MSPVKVFCRNPSCDASYSVSEDLLGCSVRCKKCGTSFVADTQATTPLSTADTMVVSALPGQESLDLPSPFGKFRPIRKLGQGGMGAVYLAHDDELDRPVALKVPLSNKDRGEIASILERFKREARSAASLLHPNFCPVYESGTVGDRPYLAMAYISGGTLNALIDEEHPMDPRAACVLVRKIALAMAEAHDKGIIHRDLKPSNVMLSLKGEPIIMDFGLARREGSGDADLTSTNAMMGTMYYMSPEQARGDKLAIGPWSDVYSLGVILFELITGDRPYPGPQALVFHELLSDRPVPRASSVRPDLAPRLVDVCARAMCKSVEGRYPSMRAFASGLDEVLGFAPPESIEPVREPSRQGPISRKMAIVYIAGLAALMLSLVLYVGTDSGTLKIEGLDPSMTIRVDGRLVAIARLSEPITLPSGRHRLSIRRGDLDVKAPVSFDVSRGKETVVRVTDNSNSKATNDTPSPIPRGASARKFASSMAAMFAGSTPGERRTVKVNGVDVDFCWCPPGSFSMGSPKDETGREEDEGPIEVRLTRGFWAMRSEVTQELFEALMGEGANRSAFEGENLPVETVTHAEAVECAKRFTQALRDSNVLPSSWEVRLPTEAEWEYAARAGTKSATSFGDLLSATNANFDGNYPYAGAEKGPFLGKTSAVGRYPANDWGLIDTAGNVYEWCLDGFVARPHGGNDPFEPGVDSSDRVIRGGGWTSIGSHCRSAYRSWNSPGSRAHNIGFRLIARDVDMKPTP